MTDVYRALKEKGYNPINQLVGYILSEDPTYITTYQGARANIRRIDRDDLLQVLELDESYEESGSALADKTFVITGSLTHYANREALKAEIEAAGGKVAGSVSAKTSYLINNDLTSTSGKNKKAHELGVPIIDEETIREWLAGGQPQETA